MSHGRWFLRLGTLALVVTLVMSTASTAAAAPGSRSGRADPSGSLQVTLTGGEWPNLDPALDTQDAADATLMDAVFGGLFEFVPNGKKTKILPDQATGYHFSDDYKKFELTLRHGLVFSNGDPMNASAVAASINRDLAPANACICEPDFAAVSTVKASGQYRVVFTLSRPFPALIYSFDATAPNWTADLTALKKNGTSAFGQHPIGAGPFEIVQNEANAKLSLQANPHYWQQGHPLAKNLTFVSVASDQSAYNSVSTDQSQVATAVTTIPTVEQAKKNSALKVIFSPATGYNFVEMNSKAPPFDNILAREAIYYATNPEALVKVLYDNIYTVVESPTASGETVYIPKVPGYRTYNLEKAKALVQQLGGITVTLGALTNTPAWENEQTALASQWEKAGITVHIQVNSLANYLQDVKTGNWQAIDTQWGTVSPALGLPTHFSSTAPLSGTRDPTVDTLIDQASAAGTYQRQVQLYTKLAERMSKNADDVFLYSKPYITITTRHLTGTTAAANSFWEDVR